MDNQTTNSATGDTPRHRVAADQIPGPASSVYYTAEERARHGQEARSLLAELRKRNVPSAARFIEDMQPSYEALALLPFIQKMIASNPGEERKKRPSSLEYEIRFRGIKNFKELPEADPLHEQYNEKQIKDAIYKAWNRRRP